MDPLDAENLNPSPFRQHLHTNYIPSDAEIGAIRAHLLPHEAELARLDALIRDLSSQRDRVKRYVASHQALISHPRRLPQDIVEEIFLACLPTQRNAAMSASEPPLLLGRICSRWRSIAFSLPGLWNTLHISADLVDREGMPTAITDWLTRASVLPLAISAHWNDPDPYDFDFDFYAATLIDTLIPFSSRWSILRLSNIRQGVFWRVANVDAPLLSDVQINFGSDDFVQGDRHPVSTGILHSKILLGGNQQKISIAIKWPSLLVPVTSFIWNHITSLTLKELRGGIGPLNLDATIRLLKGCPRLKVLALSVVAEFEGQGQAANDLLIAPCLESLSLKNRTRFSDLVSNFIDHVAMPELITLQLVNTNDSWQSDPLDILVLDRLAARSPSISDIHLDLSDISSTISIIRALLVPSIPSTMFEHSALCCGHDSHPWKSVTRTTANSNLTIYSAFLIRTREWTSKRTLSPTCPFTRGAIPANGRFSRGRVGELSSIAYSSANLFPSPSASSLA